MFKTGDVWEADKSIPIVHCISADAALGKGFAKQVRDKYPEVLQQLKEKNLKVGMAYSTETNDGRTVINLVTKPYYWNKPTSRDFISTIEFLAQLLKIIKAEKSVMPFIGTGLDKLHPTFVIEHLNNNLSEENYTIYLNEGHKPKRIDLQGYGKDVVCPTCYSEISNQIVNNRCPVCTQTLY